MRVGKYRLRRSAGVGLLELMIGIAVGLVLIAGLSSVYVNSVQGGRTTTQANQLNQEMRALMDIMVNDIRRAGYRAGADPNAPNPFILPANGPLIAAGGTCIQYSYDATELGGSAGVVDAVDRFGFRLVDGVVQAVQPGSGANCANGQWVALTDGVATAVTALSMDMGGSKCLAFDPADPTLYTEDWDAAAGEILVCDPAATNADPTFDPAVHAFIETRRVNITIEAHSVNDPDREVRLQESVLIRTNRVSNPSP